MGYKRQRGKDGLTWELQIYKGIDPVTGKKDYYYETFHGTDKEADERIKEIEVDMKRGEFVEPSQLTFYEFLRDEFLPHIEADATIGTWEDYHAITENHIKKDPLGRTILTDVTARHIEAYKRRKLQAPRLDGRPGTLSPKTVKNHIIMIKAAFKYACVLGMFKINPVEHVTFPKGDKFKPAVLNPAEAAAFVEAAAGSRYYLFFLLAIYTGMRQGELRGLRWSDVDLEKCTITIIQKVRKDGNKAVYGDPKTEESTGMISFDPEFIPLFERHRREQMEDMAKSAKLGLEYKDKHLVFAGSTGNPLDRKVIDRNLKKILKEAGITKHIRPHDLRHSCATLLISQGIHLKTVQERLRHADIRTTGNIYSHVLPRMQQEANAKMGKVLKIGKLERERQKERENQKATQ